MKKIIFSILALGSFVFMHSQTVELPETIISAHSDYINSVVNENSINYIKKLEEALLNYDHSEISNLYDSKKDIYNVTFKIPEGQIIASFNREGKIIKTFEKYKNIRLPLAVMQAVAEKYPNYSIIEDVYVANFNSDKDDLKQEYRIKIKNVDSILTVKTNKQGEFI
ncbi:hypothetical protein APS56_16245 [Pseudalgibacter alginicilyticus]|uniref:Nicotinate-nucleotide adenylyltransferase n=1 Tax=Pseudalgibacter alginicilyticus TaxID=1736674 RepID=A0A0P0CK46_9FLAO|nr:hypothetical protein [Pseudalgibacter alginicilyticus]ALJ06589.1 hypothetical protein APS56_16245 [Pseudalgibacter alginicilyticus]